MAFKVADGYVEIDVRYDRRRVTKAAQEAGNKAGDSFARSFLKKSSGIFARKTDIFNRSQVENEAKLVGTAAANRFSKSFKAGTDGLTRNLFSSRVTADADKAGTAAGKSFSESFNKESRKTKVTIGGDDKDVRRRGKGIGRHLVESFGEVIGGAAGLGSRITGSIAKSVGTTKAAVVAVGLAVAAAMPAIGSAISGALTLGFGAGIAGLGIYAAAQSEKVRDAFSSATKQIADDAKEMAKPLEGTLVDFSNDVLALHDRIKGPLTKSFKDMAPVLSSFSQQLTGAFGDFLTATLPNGTKAFNALISALGDRLSPILDRLAGAFNDVFDAISSDPEAFATLVEGIMAAVSGLISFSAVLAKAWSAVLSFFNGVSPLAQFIKSIWDQIVAIFSGVGQVLAGIFKTSFAVFNGDWKAAWEGVKLIFQGVMTAALGFARGTFQQIAAIWNSGPVQAIVAGVMWLSNAIRNAFTAVGNTLHSWGTATLALFVRVQVGITSRVIGAVTAVKNWFTNMKNAVVNTVLGWANSIVSAATNLRNGMVARVNGIVITVKSLFTNMKNTVVSTVNGWVSTLQARVAALRNNFLSRIRALRDGAVNFFNNLRRSATNIVSGMANSVTSRVSSLRDKVVNTARDLRNKVRDTFNDLKTKAIDTFKTAVRSIGDKWAELKGKLKEPVKFLIDTVFNKGIVGLWNKAAKVIPGLKEIDEYKPKSLGFAKGGVIPGYQSSKRDDRLVPMRSGEGVLVPEVVRGLGPDFVHTLNAAGNKGGVSAVKKLASGHAEGGVIDSTPKRPKQKDSRRPAIEGFSLGGIVDAVKGFVDKGKDALLGSMLPLYEKFSAPVARYLGDTFGRGNNFRSIPYHGFNHISDAIADFFGKKDEEYSDTGGDYGYVKLTGKLGNDTFGGVRPHVALMGNLIRKLFNVRDIGGKRADPFPDHPSGRALDIMTYKNQAKGDRIHDFLFANKALSGIHYNIWKQRIWYSRSKGRKMADRGSATANHWDHVHAYFKAAHPLSKVEQLVAKARKGMGTYGGSGVERWRSLVQEVLKELGLSSSHTGNVLKAIKKESGGNPRAINNWDSNAQRGDPSRGLLQTIGATFNAYAGKYKSRGIYDPKANIYAAIRYAKSRYGSGWSARMARPGGYALGGVVDPMGAGSHDVGGLLPDRGIAYNRSGEAEVVSTLDQLKSIVKAAESDGLHIHGDVILQIDAKQLKDLDDVVRVVKGIRTTARANRGRVARDGFMA